MTKIQKIVSLAAAFTLMIGLSACQLDGTNVEEERVTEFTMTLEDGSVVPCIKHSSYYGIDCNWDKVSRPDSLPTP